MNFYKKTLDSFKLDNLHAQLNEVENTILENMYCADVKAKLFVEMKETMTFSDIYMGDLSYDLQFQYDNGLGYFFIIIVCKEIDSNTLVRTRFQHYIKTTDSIEGTVRNLVSEITQEYNRFTI